MLRSTLNFLIVCLLSCVGVVNAKSLAVVEENAGRISFYDTENGKSHGTLKLGYLPHEIAVTSDGKTAYVSNFGIKDYDSNAGIPGASISVIDIPNQVEKYRLYTFSANEHKDYAQIDSAPHGVKLRPHHENQLFVNTEKRSKVLVFDVTKKTIIKTFSVDADTHNLFFSADGKILWLMAGADGVIRLNPDTGEVTGQFKLATPVRGLKYSPDNRYLMVSAVNQIVFLNPETLNVEKEFNNLGVGSILYSDITPDQKYILAPAAFDDQLLVIDITSGLVVKRIVTGLNPIAVLIDPDGTYAYVNNATDKHITKINLKDFSSNTIPVHDGPNGMAFVPSFPPQHTQLLILGVALPLSGIDAPAGRDMMRGYEYWKIGVNKSGGLFVNGVKYNLNITYVDTQSDIQNIAPLTLDLIQNKHVNILLSTYSHAGYNIENQIAIENKIVITPDQTNDAVWGPNDMAQGYDNFITTNFYNDQYYAQYNFKASNYSAISTSLGITLQKSLIEAESFNYDKLTRILAHQKFNNFYSY